MTRTKVVCVPCRRVWKKGYDQPKTNSNRIPTTSPWPYCPECKGDLRSVHYCWRPPKRNNNKAWKRITNGDWLTERDPKDKVQPLDIMLNQRRKNKALQKLYKYGQKLPKRY